MSDELLDTLRRFAPFSDLPPQALEGAAERLVRRRLAAGETLAEAGDEAHEAFVVVAGGIEVVAAATDRPGERAVLAELGPGSVVGEIAVLTSGRRSATLRATRDTELVVIPAAQVRSMLEWSPVLASRLSGQARRRLDQSALARHLARLFPDMAPAARVAIARDAQPVALAPGEVLFAEGAPADAAYLVVSGRLRVVVGGQGGSIEPVADVGDGELIGEAALLADGRRSATVVSARDTVLARLTREAFAGLVLREPTAALPVARLVLERSRAATGGPRRSQGRTSVALVPLDDRVDLSVLAAGVAARWRAAGDTTHLSRAVVDRALRADGIADAEPGSADDLRLAEWLASATMGDALTLLQADAAPSAWTRRCVALADHVALVADARSDPRRRDHEPLLVGDRPLGHQRVSLVLVHAADADHPRGTAGWLAARDVDDHHHVRPSADEDVDRLARHLAGRPVGLVLGGGGARGFAQLGVVQALRESGVPIDMVAGTSIGATIAALVALATPADDLVPLARAAFDKPIDYTVPVAGVAKGRRIAEAAARVAGDRGLEDCWTPLLCISTNLTRGQLRLHTRGRLDHAIRASVAIPGVLPPVPDEGDLLVDGGLLNNLPVDVVRRRHPFATLIAVDVAPPLGPRARQDYGLSVSGAGVLWRRLVPGLRPPKVPGVTATLMRSLIVGAAAVRDRDVESGLADLYLPLDLRGVGMLDFGAVADIAARGYDAAAAPIAEWVGRNEARWS